MFRKKRRSSSRFKARVALEALRGDKTVREIADRNDIHPTQVGAWRDRAETHLHEIFRDDQSPSARPTASTKLEIVLVVLIILIIILGFPWLR